MYACVLMFSTTAPSCSNVDVAGLTEAAHDRAVPAMAPRPPTSPVRPLKLSLAPHSKSESSLRTVPGLLQSHPGLRQTAPGVNAMQSHFATQLGCDGPSYSPTPFFKQGHAQPGLNSQPVICSPLQDNRQSQLQSQHSHSVGQFQGSLLQQPLTPSFCSTPIWQQFPRWNCAYDSPVYNTFGQPEHAVHNMTNPYDHNLTAHLMAQQQLGSMSHRAGSQTAHTPLLGPQGVQQMPNPFEGSVKKPFESACSEELSSPWMQHMVPDLFVLEATVPHLSPDLHFSPVD